MYLLDVDQVAEVEEVVIKEEGQKEELCIEDIHII